MRGRVVVEMLTEMFGAGERGGDGDGEQEDDQGSEGDEGDEDETDSDDDDNSPDDDDDEYDQEESGSEEDVEDGEQLPFEESAPYFESLTGNTTTVRSTSNHDDDDNDEEPEDADAQRSLTLASFDAPGSSRPRGRKAQGPPSVVDDAFFSLHDFHVQIDEGEAEMARALRGEFDEQDENGEDEMDLFAAVGAAEEDEDEDLDGNSE